VPGRQRLDEYADEGHLRLTTREASHDTVVVNGLTEQTPRLPPVGLLPSADSGARYQVKRICVNPGARLSLQKHFHRSEHWVVVHGVAEATIGEDVRLYHENESVYVPIGAVHRLANPGKIPLN
jgi:mannose-6-phosphate isomerase-like protein (cupin superfamily)